jgi:hypothetical protein
MPPRDPRLCPALELADVGDPTVAGYRLDGDVWKVMFEEDPERWDDATVVAWWKDGSGRQVVQLRWHAAGSTWAEAYLADGRRMRRP